MPIEPQVHPADVGAPEARRPAAPTATGTETLGTDPLSTDPLGVSAAELSRRYDAAAPGWADKMRALGYYDAYLGFLSAPGLGCDPGIASRACVIDIGAGTAAFAEAWVAVHGPPRDLALVDPSAAMLERGAAALARRSVAATCHATTLDGAARLGPVDEVLAAHLIEQFPDPAATLRQLAALLIPGGRLRLVVSKPHWCNAIIWLQWRHRSYAPSDVARFIAEAGLELIADYAFPAGPPSRTSRGYLARKV